MLDILNEHKIIIEKLSTDSIFESKVRSAIEILSHAVNNNAPILVFGNGGSAADSQHFTAELVGKFYRFRDPINAICLNSNTSTITAWANDDDYSNIFSRQIEAHHTKDSVCVCFSTSGNSLNVLKALKKARSLRLPIVAFTGKTGGKIAKLNEVLLNVPSTNTPRIQEIHIILYHYICQELEANFR